MLPDVGAAARFFEGAAPDLFFVLLVAIASPPSVSFRNPAHGPKGGR
jgi:hypothetical protein